MICFVLRCRTADSPCVCFLSLSFYFLTVELLRIAGYKSHAGCLAGWLVGWSAHTRSHARMSYCIFHIIISLMYKICTISHKRVKHSHYPTRLSLDLCVFVFASSSCILFITHRLFFDFHCLMAQSAYN